MLLLPHWKLQRHLFDHYGGGRLLWQQRGIEAFDAMTVRYDFREIDANRGVYPVFVELKAQISEIVADMRPV